MAQAIEHVSHDLWWAGMFQGVIAILFGIAAVFWPGLTLASLVYIFSAFVLIWGVVSIISSIMRMNEGGTWWLKLLFGIGAVGVGMYLVRNPDVSFNALILLIGFTLIARGVVDILGGLMDQVTATGKVLWVVLGAAAIIAGIIILNQPVAGGVAFVWILGLYALIFGPLMIAMSLDERKLLEETTSASARK